MNAADLGIVHFKERLFAGEIFLQQSPVITVHIIVKFDSAVYAFAAKITDK
jgi:hypothetical protein